jgi:hypothetical protein
VQIRNREEFALAFEALRGPTSYNKLADYLASPEVSGGKLNLDQASLWRFGSGWVDNKSGRHDVLDAIDTTIYLTVGMVLHGCRIGLSVTQVVENGAVLLTNVGGTPLISHLLDDVRSSEGHVREVGTLMEYLRAVVRTWLP